MKKKLVIILCALAAAVLVAAIAVIIVFATKEDIWVPEQQGSYVREMPYEEIAEEFVVEKYCDFKSFSESALADYVFVLNKRAAYERYSKKYFKNRDLAVIKFNKGQSGIKYCLTGAEFSDDVCAVKLVGAVKLSVVKEQPATYYCFLETEKDISRYDFSFSIEEETDCDSEQFSYITMDDKPYLFDETTPKVFVIDSKRGFENFVADDPILTEQSYSVVLLNYYYSEEFYEHYSLLLVRLPASDFESWFAVSEGDSLRLFCFRSNHYLYPQNKETEFSIFVVMIVNKYAEFGSLVTEKYFEYEDGAANTCERKEYTLSRETSSLVDVSVYTTEERE